MIIDRRRNDNIFKVLVTIIICGLSWWMMSVNSKAERVPVLEERLTNLQMSVNKIEVGIKELLSRRR